ncbi:MAG TPA: YceI family protein [Acidimicrobiales bacterium]|nr:YceI family protein [Acidimicrobiales bacterium]
MPRSDVDHPPAGVRRPARLPRPDRPPPRAYPLKWVALVLALTAAVLIGGPYLYFNVIEGNPPARLHLPPASGVAAGPIAPGPVSGNWVVATGTLAGYRVEEQLFGQSHTAVGRTSMVTGGMVISGTEVTAADFTVDMASIKSDQGSRDVQFRGFIMDTADHPHASFRLTSPIQLGAVPPLGRQVTEQAVGDLTMRGVRRSVTFTLSAERVSPDSIDINAEIPIRFSMWGIPNPSFAVAHVGDTGTLEVLLHLVAADAQGKPLHPVPTPAPTTTVFTPGSF